MSIVVQRLEEKYSGTDLCKHLCILVRVLDEFKTYWYGRGPTAAANKTQKRLVDLNCSLHYGIVSYFLYGTEEGVLPNIAASYAISAHLAFQRYGAGEILTILRLPQSRRGGSSNRDGMLKRREEFIASWLWLKQRLDALIPKEEIKKTLDEDSLSLYNIDIMG